MVQVSTVRFFGTTLSKMALSDSQKKMIQTSWKGPSANITDSGVAILYNYLKRYPDAIKYFDKFKGIPLEELKTKPHFRSHAKAIMTIFDKSVGALNTPTEGQDLTKIWHKMGVDHKKLKIPKTVFPEIKLVVLDTLKLDVEHTQAWQDFIDTAFKLMFENILIEVAKQTSYLFGNVFEYTKVRITSKCPHIIIH